MLSGFKQFLLRGNVVELAIAVVIGAAFTGVVNAVVEKVLNPAIGALFNAKNLDNAFNVTIPGPAGDAVLHFGAVIAALIQFLLVAAFIYFALVLPINSLRKRAEARRAAGEEPEDEPPTEIDLLADIRDLLSAAPTGGGRHGHAAEPEE